MKGLCGCDDPPGFMVDGNPKAPVLIINEAPSRDDLTNGRPLTGFISNMLWKQLLKKAGINRADCYIVTTIGEYPEGANGTPTKTQLYRWWDVFDEAVGCSTAKVALLLGGDALRRFTGIQGGIEDWRGYLIARDECHTASRTIEVQGTYKTSNSKRGILKGAVKIEKRTAPAAPAYPTSVTWAIPTYTPGNVVRTGLVTLPAFSADCARLGRALNGTLDIKTAAWGQLPGELVGPLCVFDIETGGIANEIITRIGAGDETDTWTAPWGIGAQQALAASLGKGPSVAFNIAFDAPRLEKNGVPIPEPWWDVMLAANILKPDLKKSLNYVTSLYLDTQRHKHLSDEDPALYNALDVVKTRQLYPILRAELVRTGQLDLFENKRMPTVPTLVRMTTRGIKVDQAVKSAWMAELSANQRAALGKWDTIAPGIKTAGKGLLDFLHTNLGLDIQYSKHGGMTSEVAALKKLMIGGTLSDHQQLAIETLLNLRGIQKELRTYAEIEISGDGCIHPGFLPAGKDTDAFGKGIAGTGRITSSNPNIQNQPQSARRMYIPHESDWVLLEGDFSQIEARIIAQLANDDELKAAIAEGLHESNQKALGVDKTRAKNGFYGWAYGAGPRTLSRTFIGRGYNISERDCAKLLRGFDERFRRTADFRRWIAATVSTSYHLSNPFGARRYFMGGSRDVPAALDYLPQSSAADIMWIALRQLEDQLRGIDAAILATVHDSILIEVSKDDMMLAMDAMKQVMEQPWAELGGLIVPVDFKIGDNWGSMQPLMEVLAHGGDF